MTAPQASGHLEPQVFADYLARTRWFAGKGRPFTVTDVRTVGEVPGRVDDSPRVVIHLVQVSYADVAAGAADAVELYQVPLAYYEHAESRLDLVRRLGILKTPTTLVLDADGREVLRASGQPRKDEVLTALTQAVPS